MSDLEALRNDYQPSPETVELVQSTPTVLLVGPTGAGKDSAKNILLENGEYHHMVSHTQREPRENNGVMEINGVDYYFVTPDEAEAMVRDGAFVEFNVFDGNLYGTSATELANAKAAGKIAITDIDVNGVAKFMELSKDKGDILAFFILPHNWQAWFDRVISRGDLSTEQLITRARTAIKEFKISLEQTYYSFVINESVDDMVSYMREVVATKHVDETKQKAGRELAQQLMEETTQNLKENDIILE